MLQSSVYEPRTNCGLTRRTRRCRAVPVDFPPEFGDAAATYAAADEIEVTVTSAAATVDDGGTSRLRILLGSTCSWGYHPQRDAQSDRSVCHPVGLGKVFSEPAVLYEARLPTVSVATPSGHHAPPPRRRPP